MCESEGFEPVVDGASDACPDSADTINADAKSILRIIMGWNVT